MISDGAGRSGTFIGISILMEQLKLEHSIDVFQTIKKIRATRPEFVQNEVCYKVLFTCLLYFCAILYFSFLSEICVTSTMANVLADFGKGVVALANPVGDPLSFTFYAIVVVSINKKNFHFNSIWSRKF